MLCIIRGVDFKTDIIKIAERRKKEEMERGGEGEREREIEKRVRERGENFMDSPSTFLLLMFLPDCFFLLTSAGENQAKTPILTNLATVLKPLKDPAFFSIFS